MLDPVLNEAANTFACELSDAVLANNYGSTDSAEAPASSYVLLRHCLNRGTTLFRNSTIGERCMHAIAALNHAIADRDYVQAKEVIRVYVRALIANIQESLTSSSLLPTFLYDAPESSESDDASLETPTAVVPLQGLS